jgi:polar amino acid transport system substrate-binding protein
MKTAMFAMAICAFLWSSMTYAEETLKCASPENPPLMYRGEDGKAQGIAVDMVTKAMEGTKYKVEVEILPWDRALAMVQESTKDCVFTIYKTPEREKIGGI